MNKIILLCGFAMILAACIDNRPNQSVWETYDVRYPVPADSNVPVSQAPRYNNYIDNDSLYTPPSNSDTTLGLCGTNSIGSANCD